MQAGAERVHRKLQQSAARRVPERARVPDSRRGAEIIEAWRHDYNHVRPHSSLGGLTPSEYANRQGDGPLERVLGSAARPPCATTPTGAKHQPSLVMSAGKVGA